MKIKRTLNHHVAALCVIALFTLTISSTAIAGNELTSGEIKKVRHLSRALLQSRALEKKRIEAEIAPQRAEIKKMEDSLGDLIADEMLSLKKVSLTPVNAQATTSAVFSPNASVQRSAVAPMTPSAGAGSSRDIQARKTVLLKKQRIKRLQDSQAAVRSARLEAEKKLPSRFAFWIKKNARDHRNENIVRTASEVEQALAKMVQNENIDLQQLKALQKKVSLSKPDIEIDDIAPTFQTKTRHRVQ